MKPLPIAENAVAWITVALHDFGGMSIQGHIGDVQFARWLLTQAQNAVTGKARVKNAAPIVVVNREPVARTSSPRGVDEALELSIVEWITVQQFAENGVPTGDIGVQGQIGDMHFAYQLLEQAKDALGPGAPGNHQIVVPNRDVTVEHVPGGRPLGDMKPSDRGEFDPRFRGTSES